jgi:hypothetical protein
MDRRIAAAAPGYVQPTIAPTEEKRPWEEFVAEPRDELGDAEIDRRGTVVDLLKVDRRGVRRVCKDERTGSMHTCGFSEWDQAVPSQVRVHREGVGLEGGRGFTEHVRSAQVRACVRLSRGGDVVPLPVCDHE